MENVEGHWNIIDITQKRSLHEKEMQFLTQRDF